MSFDHQHWLPPIRSTDWLPIISTDCSTNQQGIGSTAQTVYPNNKDKSGYSETLLKKDSSTCTRGEKKVLSNAIKSMCQGCIDVFWGFLRFLGSADWVSFTFLQDFFHYWKQIFFNRCMFDDGLHLFIKLTTCSLEHNLKKHSWNTSYLAQQSFTKLYRVFFQFGALAHLDLFKIIISWNSF